MTIFLLEIKRGRKALLIWTASVCALAGLCMAMYPEMRGQMESISNMFASLGSFTAAFGMDKMPLGTAMGFYGVEVGVILSLAGAMYAALTGSAMLAKEEGGHTAEWLLTHPVSRRRVIWEKLGAAATLILTFNVITCLCAYLSFLLIGEPAPGANFFRFHAAQTCMHWEIACVCFGFSAFMKRPNAGAGIALAFLMYVLNLFINISESASFLKYITPYQYCDAAVIFTENRLLIPEMLAGAAYAVLGALVARCQYGKKDISA